MGPVGMCAYAASHDGTASRAYTCIDVTATGCVCITWLTSQLTSLVEKTVPFGGVTPSAVAGAPRSKNGPPSSVVTTLGLSRFGHFAYVLGVILPFYSYHL